MNPALRQLLLGGRASYGFATAKDLIRKNAGDVNITVVGDSTGNETTEWVYLFAQWLAGLYPTHSVSYRLWNDTSGNYDTATAIATGSGSNTIRIWNASVAGSPAFYLMGAKLAASITGTNADLVIFNHGKNDVSGQTAPQIRGEFFMAMETVRQALPNARTAALLQNPNRDDDAMTPAIDAWRVLGAQYGDFPLPDVFSLFLAQNKASSLYADNLHPSAAGTQLFLQAVQALWTAGNKDQQSQGAFLSRTATNLLANANFGDPGQYSGGTPTGWSALASPTCSLETTIVDSGKSQALKIVGTSAQASIRYSVSGASLNLLKGATATVAVRLYTPAAGASTAGRIAIGYVDGGSTALTSRATTLLQGAYAWVVISGFDIPATATSVFVNLYCDTAANTSSAAYYDRAILIPGPVPMNCA